MGTYTALEASEIVSADAVAAVAQRICTMLAPLADEGTELKRYHSCKQLLCVYRVLADRVQCIRLLNPLSI